MTQFGQDAKSLIGISGICIGVGEILGESSLLCVFLAFIYDAFCHMKVQQRERGSALRNVTRLHVDFYFLPFLICVWPGGGVFGMLNKNNRFGRNPVVLLGLITHFAAFYLIFLNIASDAPLAPEAGTDQQGYITPRYKECCSKSRNV